MRAASRPSHPRPCRGGWVARGGRPRASGTQRSPRARPSDASPVALRVPRPRYGLADEGDEVAGAPPASAAATAESGTRAVTAALVAALGGAAATGHGDQLLAALKDFAVGGFAAAVGTAAVYPLDLVKTRMQVDPGRFASALQCASAAVGGPGGVRGLYAGMGAQLLGVAPEKSLKLLAYTAAHAALLDYLAAPHGGELPFGWEALAGCAAGCAQTLVACPLEAMKIPLQMAGAGDPAAAAAGAESSSPPPSVAAIAAGLGLRGLFRGVGVCLLRDAASGALFFACFAAAKHFLRAEVPGLDAFVLRLVAGTAAGVPAALLTTPLDVVKTRMQAEGVAVAGAAGAGGGGGSASASALETAAEALRSGGLAALWLGAGERAARMAPSLGITLAIYQALDGID